MLLLSELAGQPIVGKFKESNLLSEIGEYWTEL
jgi:hypothetical protein